MKTQPKNNNIEVSFESSIGYEYFTKTANYKDVCEILFATEFKQRVCEFVHFVRSLDVDYILIMRIGNVILKQVVPQNIVFNTEPLREMFKGMQSVIISLVIDKVWEEQQ